MRQFLGLALVALVITTFSPSLAGDEPEFPSDYADITDQLFILLEEKGGVEAIAWLFATNPYTDRMLDAIDRVKNQFGSVEDSLGSYIDKHILIDKPIGSRYVYRYYLVDFDRQPFSFQFHSYGPRERWQVQNFIFNGDVSAYVATFAKYNLLDQ